MVQKNLIELKGVSKSFKAADGSARLVLDQVDFSLKDGEIVALLGKSGSGKSTLLRIMAGLIPADQGQMTVKRQESQGAQHYIELAQCRRAPR